jgi:hypothetical protein
MTKQEYIRVVAATTDGVYQVITIKNDLKTLQSFVGGLIDVITIEGMLCIINDEGRIYEMERSFAYEIAPNYWDCIHGNAIFVGDDGEEFGGLSDKEIFKAVEIFKKGHFVLGKLKEREALVNG